METIKSYTSLVQSKKLAEILPLESADMSYVYPPTEKDEIQKPMIGFYISSFNWYKDVDSIIYIPCWSLAALLEEIPEVINFDDDENDYILEILKESGLYYLSYGNPLKGDKLNIEPQENFVDACMAMIEELHELKLL